MIIAFSHMNSVAQMFVITFIANILTFIFHKICVTNENVIYKLFNIFISFILTFVIDLLLIITLKFQLPFYMVVQEIVLLIATPFISQKFYDWWKSLTKEIKDLLTSHFKVIFIFKIERKCE